MGKLLALCFSTLLLASCSSQPPIVDDYSRNVRIRSFPQILKPRPILFAADNQFQNIYTDANILGIRASDMVSRVAIRPAAVNLFTPELFRFVLKKNQSRTLIHLGDALNIGCRNEWEKFTGILDSVKSINWIMAPGNHDFYFYGVTSGGWFHDVFNTTWADGCIGIDVNKPANADKPFQKNDFIDEYLKHLKDSNIIVIHDGNIKNSDDVEAIEASNSDPSAFYLKLDVYKYLDSKQHKSFITQYVNLSTDANSPTIGVILDTTNYHYEPTNIRGFLHIFSHNPGVQGYVDNDQLELIKTSLQGFKTKYAGPLNIIFMGHHPFDDLNEEIREYFYQLKQDNSFNFNGYISAHTHSGFLAKHQERENPRNEFIEYNIGSVTDWPVEVAVLDRALIEKIDTHISELQCNSNFNYSSSAVSNYTAYRQEAENFWAPGQKEVNVQHRY